MARARNIKPAFFKNEDLGQLSAHARLLFIGLWCLADVKGRLEDRPARIKAELFPYETVNVDELLNELASSEGDFIARYVVDDQHFIEITKFHLHQNPHPNEKKKGSQIPPPDVNRGKNRDKTFQVAYQSLTSSAESLLMNPSIRIPTPNKSEADKSASVFFDEFWKIYPRKVNRKGSLEYWQKHQLDSKHSIIIDAVQREMRCEQWNTQGGRFVPHPLTFLRQERYIDLTMDISTAEPVLALVQKEDTLAKRDALLAFPFIRVEGSLVASTVFTTDDAYPDRLFAFGNSYALSLLEGVQEREAV